MKEPAMGTELWGQLGVTTVLGSSPEATSQGWGSDSGRKSPILMYHIAAIQAFSCGSIVMHGVGVYRAAFQVLQYRTSWISQYKSNFSILLCSFVVVRTYVLAKSWISIWGSENMAPITIVQLDCELN